MKALSHHQYGCMLAIRNGKVTVDSLHLVKDVTIWSLLRRDYVGRYGRGEDAVLVLTPLGEEAVEFYRHATMPLRKVEAPLTERLQGLLGMARVIRMQLRA